MVSPYLIRVISKPTKVDHDLWNKWYTEVHIPDLINSGTATRAAFYHAFDDYTLSTKTPQQVAPTKLGGQFLNHTDFEPPGEKRFLAMYQSDHAEPLATENAKQIRTEHDMLPGKAFRPCAEWDTRIYKLIENYDPRGLGETSSPYLLQVQNEPADVDGYHKFYHEEHLMMLNKVPGYRRSQRYELTDAITKGRQTPEQPPRFLAVHEWENLDALDGPEQREADASENTIRVFGNAKMVSVRGFKLYKYFNGGE